MTLCNIAVMSKERKAIRDDVLKRFGTRLRSARTSRGFSQESLAAKAGFSRSYYTEIETGKRNVSLVNLYTLAQCLCISLNELLDINVEEQS